MEIKEKVIEAVKQLIVEYTNGDHLIDPEKCSLCLIFYKGNCNCTQCPNIVFGHGGMGCLFRECPPSAADGNYSAVIRCREFWKKVLPKFEKMPPKYFTKSGFKLKNFEFMIDIDNEVGKI